MFLLLSGPTQPGTMVGALENPTVVVLQSMHVRARARSEEGEGVGLPRRPISPGGKGLCGSRPQTCTDDHVTVF